MASRGSGSTGRSGDALEAKIVAENPRPEVTARAGVMIFEELEQDTIRQGRVVMRLYRHSRTFWQAFTNGCTEDGDVEGG